jgi:hypothetical protein
VAKVLFVTDQWGYGTTTSATSIAAALEGLDTRWFIGEGAGFTLGKRNRLEECIPANTMAPSPPEALKEAVRASDVVVSVMNPNAANVADRLGVPCVYVDMLLWMWDRPPRLPSSVTRYFAEGFTGVGESIERWRDRLPRAEVIAPLIVPAKPVNARDKPDVLVNFGGLSSWLMPQDSLVTYARTMVECVVEALAKWPGRITISAGEHVLNPVDSAPLRLARRDVRFVNLSQAEYLRELERSRFLISSPGLHATQEALVRGIPCVLLPSQNLSQVLALGKLNRAGAAFALDWDTIYDLGGLSTRDERSSCLRIANCIRRFQRDVLARGRLIWHLTAQLSPDRLNRLAAAQAAFFEPYRGEFGPNRVAAYIRHLVSAASPISSGPAQTALAEVGLSAPSLGRIASLPAKFDRDCNPAPIARTASDETGIAIAKSRRGHGSEGRFEVDGVESLRNGDGSELLPWEGEHQLAASAAAAGPR